jgi:uncharacterized alkaline shock family protein YloU
VASQPPVDGAEPVDPGERGSLAVRDKVAQRVAVHAALATPGVRARAAGLDLSIAVVWPASLAAVGIAVQRNVTRALTDSAGFQVDGVDVSIEAVVSDDEHGRNLS